VIYDIDNISLYPIDSTKLACPEWKANTVLLYQNNSRHTINNFLDEEEPVNFPLAEKQPPNQLKINVPFVINDTLILPDVLFKLNSSELNPRFSLRIDSLVKKIQQSTYELKHTNMKDVRKFLLKRGFIKVGSIAPNDVLRKMYESTMLICGDVQNHNPDNLLYNFLNNNEL
jgi:hypothetical protein